MTASSGAASVGAMFFGTGINANATSVFAANVIDILDYANTNKYTNQQKPSFYIYIFNFNVYRHLFI